VRLTNSREVAAFFVTRAIIIAIYFAVTPLLLAPLFSAMFRSGGVPLMTLATTSVTFVTWMITLLLFIALRGGFGGVPPMVAGYGRPDAVTSSGGEIGAFLLSVLIVMAAQWALAVFVLAGIYASLRQSGNLILIMPIGIGVSVVFSVVFFLLFIAIRGAMPAAASPDAPIEAYGDGGGASMGFGQAIATCFRKYAVFSGRASRSEYWFFVLFEMLLFIVLVIVGGLVFRDHAGVLLMLAVLILLLPRVAVLVRRLHDTDRSAWWILIPFVPIIGSIWLIVLLCTRGTDGANRYGMGPVQAAIPEVFA
jgi:uncharacterized membrane protein YhaH (DUF805 family)